MKYRKSVTCLPDGWVGMLEYTPVVQPSQQATDYRVDYSPSLVLTKGFTWALTLLRVTNSHLKADTYSYSTSWTPPVMDHSSRNGDGGTYHVESYLGCLICWGDVFSVVNWMRWAPPICLGSVTVVFHRWQVSATMAVGFKTSVQGGG